jgi:AcrR family transcriptional regulator
MARTKQASSVSRRVKAKRKKPLRWNGAPGLRSQRREAILRSVASVLQSSGLSSLTIQDIASELGITKGNLYYYFKDKQDILFQCHMRCMEIGLNAVKEAMAGDRSPSERLRVLLLGHIRGILDDGFGSVLQTDLESLWPEQRRQYIRKRDELEHAVRRLIEDGVRAGEFECRNVKLAGFAILGAINWMPKWYRPSGELSAETIAEDMVAYFLRGLSGSDVTASNGASRRSSKRENPRSHFQQQTV